MKRFSAPALFFALAPFGCGPQVGLDADPDGSTAAATSTMTDGPSSATMVGDATTVGSTLTTTPPSDTTFASDDATSAIEPTIGVDDATDEGSVPFISIPDGWGCAPGLPPGTLAHCSYCDLFAQDCPRGDKCTPWANDGGTAWNATRCSPIDPSPAQTGEACTMQGSAYSGLDDCDIGLMCMFVDPVTLHGVCVPHCAGSFDNPICADEAACMHDYDGAVVLCLPPCDPLLDDCELGTCIPTGDDFVCFADGDDVALGDPCEFHNDCAPGLACVAAEATGTCEGYGCCTSLCDLGSFNPDAPCLPGQACTPWYAPGSVMPPLDAIGACTMK